MEVHGRKQVRLNLEELGTSSAVKSACVDHKTAPERCRKRYAESRKKYEKYFFKCLEEIEDLQPSAFAGVQVSRLFTMGVLPKYCTIKDPLTRKQRERVEQIVSDRT